MKIIAVLGLGNIGFLAAGMLHKSKFDVIGVDQKSITQNSEFQCLTLD